MRRGVGASIAGRWALFLLLSALPVRAQPAEELTAPPEKFRYLAPEECGTKAALESKVEVLAGLSFADAPSDLSIEVIIEQRGQAYGVKLRTASPDGLGERSLEAASCPLAIEAVTLLIALLLNPDAELEAQDDETVDSTTVPEPRSERRDKEQPKTRVPPQRLTPVLGAGFAAGWGHLPGWGGAVQIHGGVETAAWGIEARGRLWLPQTVALAEVPGARVGFTLGSGALLACGKQAHGRPTLELCAGPVLLIEQGRATGITAPTRSSAIWGAARGELGARFRLAPRAWGRLQIGADFSPEPPNFLVDGLGQIHRAAHFSPHGGFSYVHQF